MQYYLCPRCQFRVAINKNVCHTCGFSMSSLKNSQNNAEQSSTAEPTTKTAVWAKFLGLSGPRKETGKEKPALG
jgi:hypothetical protein